MATLTQERHVELVAGTDERFVITSLMATAAIPAELPHVSVFVLSIVNRDDALQDTFSRVAQIADLSKLPVGRDAALSETPGINIEYLSSSAINSYTTLTDGLNGAQAIRERVNALVIDWTSFSLNFNAPNPSPANYTIPLSDVSQKGVLIAAYKVAKQSRYIIQLAKAAADTALTAAQDDYAYKQQRVTDLSLSVATSATVQTEMATLIAAGTTFLGTASAVPPTIDQKAAFQAALNIANGYNIDTALLSSTLTAYQTSWQADTTIASTVITTAQYNQVTQTQLLASAHTLEDVTLAAVLAICPDFDLHSIALVDG